MSDKEAKLAAARKRAQELKAKKGRASDDKAAADEPAADVDDAGAPQAADVADADSGDLGARISELERLLAESRRAGEDLQRQLTETVDGHEAALQKLRADRDEARRDRDAAESRTQALEKQIDTLKAELDRLAISRADADEELRAQLDALQLEHDSLLAGTSRTAPGASPDATLTKENQKLKGRIADLERLVAAVRASQPPLNVANPTAADDGMHEVPLDDDDDATRPGPKRGPRTQSEVPRRDLEALRAGMTHIQLDLTSWYDKLAGEIVVL